MVEIIYNGFDSLYESRIRAAEANGIIPDAGDIALVATERRKSYAIAQSSGVMNIDKLAKHIASHGSVYKRADIAAVLCMATDCIREQLLEGKRVRLGDLGDFSITLTSNGSDTPDDVIEKNITGVNVNWNCGKNFKNLLDDAEFNLVASRSAQAAILKASKSGKKVVNI